MSCSVLLKTGLLVFSLSLLGCGRGLQAPIDSELRPYFDEFYAEGAKRGVDLPLIRPGGDLVDELSETTNEVGEAFFPAGFCYGWLYQVEIRKSAWYGLSETKKKELVFHELGHCVLGRDHTFARAELWSDPKESYELPLHITDAPDSLMSIHTGWPVEPSSGFQNFWDTYLDELFLQKPVGQVERYSARAGQRRLQKWRGEIDPVLARFSKEATSRGVQLPELEVSYEMYTGQSPPHTLFAEEVASIIRSLKGWNVFSGDALEFVLFGMAAQKLMPLDNYKYAIEFREGLPYPGSLRGYFYILGNPKLGPHYRAHREEYLKELFGK